MRAPSTGILLSARLAHTLSNEAINSRAIDIYQEVISLYSDQSLTPSLKQHVLKGMFLNNEIGDISNPVFKRLNSIVRQDPNLFDDEKLELISTLTTNGELFETNNYNHRDDSYYRDVLRSMGHSSSDTSLSAIQRLMSNDTFHKKAITSGLMGISLLSVITYLLLV